MSSLWVPEIPTTFPCWCRALYSWSGENKGDLGFVEGDWIECLNQGDGNFWYGRLKRNHATGFFPKNFIEVLEGHTVVDSDKNALPSVEPPRLPTHSINYDTDKDLPYSPRQNRNNGKRHETQRATNGDRTPSPLRAAMDELMESLEKLGSPIIGSNFEPLKENNNLASRASSRSLKASQGHNDKRTSRHRRHSHSGSVDTRHSQQISALQEQYRREMLALSSKHSFSPGVAIERVQYDVGAYANPQPPPHGPAPLRPNHGYYNSSAASSPSTTSPSMSDWSGSAYSTAPSSISNWSDRKPDKTMSNRKRGIGVSNLSTIPSERALDLHLAHDAYLDHTSTAAPIVINRKGFMTSAKQKFDAVLNRSGSTTTVSQYSTEDWQRVRREVNRSLTPTPAEIRDVIGKFRAEGVEIIQPVAELRRNVQEVDDGTDFSSINFALIDKATRYTALPPARSCNPAIFAKTVLCRPYASPVQRLRAIFLWVSEKITYEMATDFTEPLKTSHLVKVLQYGRGNCREVAHLVAAMCEAMNIDCEVVTGYLKEPSAPLGNGHVSTNHCWNAVFVNGSWRIMDVVISNPQHPLSPDHSLNQIDSFYFLARPSEMIWTHIPLSSPGDQFILPHPLPLPVLLSLPCPRPAFFKHRLRLRESFDPKVHTQIEGLQTACIDILIRDDVEVFAEVESELLLRDSEGDALVGSGQFVKKSALSQVVWMQGSRVARIKAVVPVGEDRGLLKIYAGAKGLMTSANDNPHQVALMIPLQHKGPNIQYDFLTRHPTLSAQRHDVYVKQPQCRDLFVGASYIFSIDQHPSSIANADVKPLRLAIQNPRGKIFKCSQLNDTGLWTVNLKINEPGKWQGVLQTDRISKWSVFAEWQGR